jgi:putative SOS response-associated peptidase YedK
MCGRARLSTDFNQIKIVFRIPPERPTPNYAPTYNLAPTDPIPIIRYDAQAGERSLEVVRWWLVPWFWKKEIKEFRPPTFNARAEGVERASSFRLPFERRRCLIPLDGFYEWQTVGKAKQPYAIGLKDGSLMAMAGLWDICHPPGNETVRSATIITCPSNELVGRLHNRMPVILPERAWSMWLGEESSDIGGLKALLVPYPANEMTVWPVSTLVNSVKNNAPSLIEPISLGGEG